MVRLLWEAGLRDASQVRRRSNACVCLLVYQRTWLPDRAEDVARSLVGAHSMTCLVNAGAHTSGQQFAEQIYSRSYAFPIPRVPNPPATTRDVLTSGGVDARSCGSASRNAGAKPGRSTAGTVPSASLSLHSTAKQSTAAPRCLRELLRPSLERRRCR